MAIKTSSKEGGLFTEINITPLTDIFLVLLIIMMVLAPMFQSVDKSISMPKIKNGGAVENNEVTVSVTKTSEFFVNAKVTTPDQLQAALSGLLSKAKNKTVVVKADTDTKSKEIMRVMRAAKEAGFEKLTVAGEPLSQQQVSKLHSQN